MNRKKLLVLGASGGTGRHIVMQALEAGHEVTAYVRTSDRAPTAHDRLNVTIGTVTENGLRLAEAVVGQDAVISALGRGTSLRSTGLIQQSVPVILSAMRAHRVCRLIFTSAIGVGGDLRGLPLVSRLMTRWVLTNIYRDKAGGESLIRASDLDWTLVQPSQLTNGPLTGSYRVGEGLALRGMPRIARADVAHFILSQLDDPTYIRKVVRISH